MARDKLTVKETLSALVIKPRSVQRCHEQRQLGSGTGGRAIAESIEIEKKEKDNAAGN